MNARLKKSCHFISNSLNKLKLLFMANQIYNSQNIKNLLKKSVNLINTLN